LAKWQSTISVKPSKKKALPTNLFSLGKKLKEGYLKTLKKVKKESHSKNQPAYNRRKILHGTGNLKRSFRYISSAEQIEIRSDVKYAAVHNYGVNDAGRNRNVKIPKRQFITPYIPQHLENKLIDTIEKDLTKILQP
jgi:phage gpG-like protein